MKKIFILLLISAALVFSGCGPSSSIGDMSIKQAPKKLQEYINQHSSKNGIYLYTEKNNYYVFFNYSNVEPGEKPAYIEINQMDMDKKSKVLTIKAVQMTIDNPGDAAVASKRLVKVFSKENIDKINVFLNGNEAYFENLSSN